MSDESPIQESTPYSVGVPSTVDLRRSRRPSEIYRKPQAKRAAGRLVVGQDPDRTVPALDHTAPDRNVTGPRYRLCV